MTTFTDKKMWGNSMSFINYERRRLSGHSPVIPKPGDLFEHLMESGKIGVFKFEEVTQCSNPPDMFFATMSDVGYKDEIDANS